MINTKPVLGDMRLNVTDKLGKHEVFNGETWLIMENYDTIESLRAEIEALKRDNKELHAIAQRMAMAESDARKSLQWFKDVQAISSGEKTILTDEEILKMAADKFHYSEYKLVIEFARAILRKAQEK